jgi:hypothetical protein
MVWVCLLELCSFSPSKVFNSLVSLEVVFDKVYFSFVIDPFVSVRAIAIHVSESIRSASVRKKNSNLMKSFRTIAPKVPCHVWIMQISLGVSFLTMDEIRKLDWIFNEKYRGVVANHVKVSFFCVELKSESSGVSYYIRKALFSSHC